MQKNNLYKQWLELQVQMNKALAIQPQYQQIKNQILMPLLCRLWRWFGSHSLLRLNQWLLSFYIVFQVLDQQYYNRYLQYDDYPFRQHHHLLREYHALYLYKECCLMQGNVFYQRMHRYPLQWNNQMHIQFYYFSQQKWYLLHEIKHNLQWIYQHNRRILHHFLAPLFYHLLHLLHCLMRQNFCLKHLSLHQQILLDELFHQSYSIYQSKLNQQLQLLFRIRLKQYHLLFQQQNHSQLQRYNLQPSKCLHYYLQPQHCSQHSFYSQLQHRPHYLLQLLHQQRHLQDS